MEISANARIFPRATSLRRMGVISMVAIVPRSFSPAMDSGATAAQPEYRNIISSRGIIIAKKLPAASSAVARS